MTIYTALKNDHDKVRSLLKDLAEATSAEKRQSLVSEIRNALVPHSRAEEMVLYNTLRDLDKGKGLLADAYQEHVKAETLLRGLQVAEAVHLTWQSGVDKLRQEVEHHIAEEEGQIFPAARKVFSDEEALKLAETFSELKSKVSGDFLSSQIELMVNLMPARFRASFAKLFTEGTRKAS